MRFCTALIVMYIHIYVDSAPRLYVTMSPVVALSSSAWRSVNASPLALPAKHSSVQPAMFCTALHEEEHRAASAVGLSVDAH